MMLKKLSFGLIAGLGCALLAAPALAASCALSDVKLTSHTQYADTNGTLGAITTFNPALDSAACLGSFDGQGDDGKEYYHNGQPYPGVNVGLFGDGLINGYSPKGEAPLFPNGAFLTTDDLIDLNGDDVGDPGWIMIGKVDIGKSSNDTTYSKVDGNESITKKVDFGVEQTAAGKGTWWLRPDVDIVDAFIDLFGTGKYLDQFAIAFKAGTQFALYNFTIESMKIDPITVGAGKLPYIFEGTFDFGDKKGTLEGKEISNVVFYARDPFDQVTPNPVPEPNSLALLGLALAGLASVSRRKR